MKKLMNLVIMTTMVLFVCSCGDNRGQQQNNENLDKKGKEVPQYYSYQIVEEIDKGYTDGRPCLCYLVILYGNDNSANYVMFDDEEQYYDDCIYEWTMALAIAKKLYLYRIGDLNQKNAYLKTVHCLPNCLDAYGVVDGKAKETIMKTYYDIQDATIYEPEHRYGKRRYPVDETYGYGIKHVELFRTNGQDENVPSGALGIKFTYY